MRRHNKWALLVTILAGGVLAGSWTALAADTAMHSEAPARIEDIVGSDLKRIVLTPRAAERLAIATEPIRNEPVMRWMLMTGEVEAVSMELAAPATSTAKKNEEPSPVLVRVPLVDREDKLSGHATLVLSLGLGDDDDDDDEDEDDDDQRHRIATHEAAGSDTAIVLPVGDDGTASLMTATEMPAGQLQDGKSQYYTVGAASYRLRPGQRVFVRVPQPGSGTPQRVVPYSGVLYDPYGNAWVYTNPEPLTFIRYPIDIEYIEGDLAVLKEGPAIGVEIVVSGATELMGVEQKVGH